MSAWPGRGSAPAASRLHHEGVSGTSKIAIYRVPNEATDPLREIRRKSLDLVPELHPSGEAILSGKNQLRIVQSKASALESPLGMVLREKGGRFDIVVSDGSKKLFGLLL